jgi:hypothetical protein
MVDIDEAGGCCNSHDTPEGVFIWPAARQGISVEKSVIIIIIGRKRR